MLDILKIEAAALLKGLQMAWIKGYKKVEIECDNNHLVGILQSGLAPINKTPSIQQVGRLSEKDWFIRFRCIGRSYNAVADHLAKLRSCPIG